MHRVKSRTPVVTGGRTHTHWWHSNRKKELLRCRPGDKFRASTAGEHRRDEDSERIEGEVNAMAIEEYDLVATKLVVLLNLRRAQLRAEDVKRQCRSYRPGTQRRENEVLWANNGLADAWGAVAKIFGHNASSKQTSLF